MSAIGQILTRNAGEGATARTAPGHAPSTSYAGSPPPFTPFRGRIR